MQNGRALDRTAFPFVPPSYTSFLTFKTVHYARGWSARGGVLEGHVVVSLKGFITAALRSLLSFRSVICRDRHKLLENVFHKKQCPCNQLGNLVCEISRWNSLPSSPGCVGSWLDNKTAIMTSSRPTAETWLCHFFFKCVTNQCERRLNTLCLSENTPASSFVWQQKVQETSETYHLVFCIQPLLMPLIVTHRASCRSFMDRWTACYHTPLTRCHSTFCHSNKSDAEVAGCVAVVIFVLEISLYLMGNSQQVLLIAWQ